MLIAFVLSVLAALYIALEVRPRSMIEGVQSRVETRGNRTYITTFRLDASGSEVLHGPSVVSDGGSGTARGTMYVDGVVADPNSCIWYFEHDLSPQPGWPWVATVARTSDFSVRYYFDSKSRLIAQCCFWRNRPWCGREWDWGPSGWNRLADYRFGIATSDRVGPLIVYVPPSSQSR